MSYILFLISHVPLYCSPVSCPSHYIASGSITYIVPMHHDVTTLFPCVMFLVKCFTHNKCIPLCDKMHIMLCFIVPLYGFPLNMLPMLFPCTLSPALFPSVKCPSVPMHLVPVTVPFSRIYSIMFLYLVYYVPHFWDSLCDVTLPCSLE